MEKLKYFKVAILVMFVSSMAWGWNIPEQTKNTQGQIVKLEKNYVLLYFWATWCPDCKHTMQSVLPKFANDNLQILAINTDTSDNNIEEFKESNKITIATIADADKKIRKEFKVFSVPTGVLLKKDKDQWVVQKTFIGDEIKLVPQDLEVVKK